MDNNFNNIDSDILQMAKNMESFIDKLKSGDCLGLDEKQKIEFRKQLQQNGALKSFEEAKIKLAELKSKK